MPSSSRLWAVLELCWGSIRGRFGIEYQTTIGNFHDLLKENINNQYPWSQQATKQTDQGVNQSKQSANTTSQKGLAAGALAP